MADIKPSDHGIVVEHKENGMRFAISDKNYDEKVHCKVRDLRAGETVRGYQPERREASEGGESPQGGTSTPEKAAKSESGRSEALADGSAGSAKATPTEGAAPAASQEKEGK